MSWRIKDWNEIYENNRTRGLKKLEWVPIPNKMDGDGYTQLLDHPDGAAHFGVWIALVEIASKCEKRGTLHRDAGRPHDAATLARVSRIPAQLFKEAIPRLIEIGWIEEVTVREMKELALIVNPKTEEPQDDAGIPHDGAGIEHEGAPSRARRRTPENGMERNGMEGNGNERNGSAPPLESVSAPQPDTGNPETQTRSSVSPIRVPSKPMGLRRPPGTASQILTPVRIDRMRAELQSYMQKPGHPPVKPPDDPIVLQCLSAVGQVSMDRVHQVLREIRQNGSQAPHQANGPRGYAWFPAILTAHFRAGPEAQGKAENQPGARL